jgi:hypothetical protein
MACVQASKPPRGENRTWRDAQRRMRLVRPVRWVQPLQAKASSRPYSEGRAPQRRLQHLRSANHRAAELHCGPGTTSVDAHAAADGRAENSRTYRKLWGKQVGKMGTRAAGHLHRLMQLNLPRQREDRRGTATLGMLERINLVSHRSFARAFCAALRCFPYVCRSHGKGGAPVSTDLRRGRPAVLLTISVLRGDFKLRWAAGRTINMLVQCQML